MKQNRKGLLSIFVVLPLILILALSFVSIHGAEQVPKVLQLNPSLDFDKEAIEEWAEEHSWEETYKLAEEAHKRSVEDGPEVTFARFYTPLMTWVEANYKGSQRFWSQEEIQEDYQTRLERPTETAYFLVGIARTSKAGVRAENLRFVLEVGDRHWETSNVRARELETQEFWGTTRYMRPIDIDFDFTDMEGHPEWSEWTLYIIRKDVMGREELTWDFE